MARLRDIAGFVEKEVSRALLSATERALGPGAAVALFARAPLLRRTPARLRFLRDLIRRRRGDAAAREAALRLLCGRPAGHWYATLLAQGPAAPSAAALEAAIDRLIAAAPSAGDLALLAVALQDASAPDLAARCVAALRAGAAGPGPRRGEAGGGGAEEALAASCLRPLGAPPHAEGAAPDFGDLDPGPAENRLLIVEKATPVETIAALGAGARRLTVIVFGDLYAGADMASALAEALPGVAVSVEHARTRADRFAPRYNALHRATAGTAAALMDAWREALAELLPREMEMAALRPALELELADLLFFGALRANAALAAARDPAFDDVVFCFDRDWRFYRVALCDPALAADPRLRACCRAPTVAGRRGHFARLRQVLALRDAPPAPPAPGRRPRADLLAAVERFLARAAGPRGPARAARGEGGREVVALASGQDRAYVGDSAAIAAALSRRFDVDVMWTRGRPSVMASHLRTAKAEELVEGPPGDRGATTLIGFAAPQPPPQAARAFARLLRGDAAGALPALARRLAAEPAAQVALSCELDGAAPPALLAALWRARAALATLRRSGARALAICPARTPTNLQLAAAARAAGIPSVAVEPHCLNAAYCRYAATPTDATLVCLEYFAEEYRRHFGAAPERCLAIGSPRIRPPRDYDGDAARRTARMALGFDEDDPPIVVVPTQPMAAEHAFAVWRQTARAVAGLERPVRVLVKPHPEEGPDRAQRYMAVAAEEGAAGRCALAGEDVKLLLRAAELALVFYSVTALEAAALERPVIVIGRRGAPYPVPYDAVLGAPFCADAGEIRAAVLDALEGADALRRLAAFRAGNPQIFDDGFGDRLCAAVAGIAREGAAAIRPIASLPTDPFVTAPFTPYFSEAAP